jgi:hypothetical protein
MNIPPLPRDHSPAAAHWPVLQEALESIHGQELKQEDILRGRLAGGPPWEDVSETCAG